MKATPLEYAPWRATTLGATTERLEPAAVLALAFGARLLAGGAFEPRTVVALLARTGVWAGIAV